MAGSAPMHRIRGLAKKLKVKVNKVKRTGYYMVTDTTDAAGVEEVPMTAFEVEEYLKEKASKIDEVGKN